MMCTEYCRFEASCAAVQRSHENVKISANARPRAISTLQLPQFGGNGMAIESWANASEYTSRIVKLYVAPGRKLEAGIASDSEFFGVVAFSATFGLSPFGASIR